MSDDQSSPLIILELLSVVISSYPVDKVFEVKQSSSCSLDMSFTLLNFGSLALLSS